MYESFETALADQFPTIAQEMLNVFGAVISGARHNAVRGISPATTEMLLKTVRDSAEASEEVHIGAICASAKSIQGSLAFGATHFTFYTRASTNCILHSRFFTSSRWTRGSWTWRP